MMQKARPTTRTTPTKTAIDGKGIAGRKHSRAAAAPADEPKARGEEAGRAKVVGAVVGAIKILRFLSDSRAPIGVSRIAKETELNTSTTFNILRTLALHDLVDFDAVGKTYSLSLGLMDIARGATAVGGDIGALRPTMERIAHDRGVTVTLWQPVSLNRKVLILSALARNAVRIQMAVGQRLPIYIGATGRVFAAFRGDSEAELRARFKEIRWERPINFKAFSEQVNETREQGWATDDGNFAAGTFSVAVPILDAREVAIMAVTATMFTGEQSKQRALDIVRDLREFALKASRVAAG